MRRALARLSALSMIGMMAVSVITACQDGSQAGIPITTGARIAIPAASGPSTASPMTTPSVAKTTFGDGEWAIGKDIVAGTYTTQSAGNCRWHVESGSGGGQNGNIADDNSSGQVTIAVSSTDKVFTSEGCGTWVRQ